MDFMKTVLGMEMGSTRIKAVLIDENHTPIAQGDYEWENQLIDGIWTYSMEQVYEGVHACYKALKADVSKKYGVTLTEIGAMGVSAMMHGYLVFDKDWKQLVPFRTWRNTITGEAAEKLSRMLDFNMPQRWSAAHLYQAILNKEPHVKDIAHLTTLAGYISFLLTGENAVGMGEASGMFPIDSRTLEFDAERVKIFDEAAGVELVTLLPRILLAGQCAGRLTPEGARFLDPEGDLKSGVPVAPCEGDAGTGMVATNSVRVKTGNFSAGTSAFAMIVTDKKLKAHKGIDMIATPAGLPVAMVHCNTCTSEINAWARMFKRFADGMGVKVDMGDVYTFLFKESEAGDKDAGGTVLYNYLAGEDVVDLNEGRPMLVRKPEASFTLANFMKAQLLSAIAVVKIGMDTLIDGEKLEIERLTGHGGYFKTPEVGQRILSAAVNAPVTVMETAGEGGPYGMALLAAYMLNKREGEKLEDYLDSKVFASAKSVTIMADQADVDGFRSYMELYKRTLPAEAKAVEVM
ncbi:MAG: ATPase [Clostridia bacterium]|nr:ATPase [Clostridia bacterium]